MTVKKCRNTTVVPISLKVNNYEESKWYLVIVENHYVNNSDIRNNIEQLYPDWDIYSSQESDFTVHNGIILYMEGIK